MMFKKFITVICLMLIATIMIIPNVEAENLEIYQKILMSKKYTIRYENITPSPRVTNKDRVELFGSSGMAVNQNDYLKNKIKIGLVIGNGDDRYEEVGDGKFDMCRLTKNNENFLFTKYTKNNQIEYYGVKKNKVEANSRNYLAEIIEGQSYGDNDVSKLLNAILPNSMKTAEMIKYHYVMSGKLDNGLNYEDYKSNDDNTLNAIRYYFKGNNLVKIASISYHKNDDGTIEGRKCIIRIKEFSANPDVKYLSLPAGVEDVTNRKNREA